MNDTERLQAIRAKCVELLEIASKRTPGEWIRNNYDVRQPAGRMIADVGPSHTAPHEYPLSCKLVDERNGDFIATCAGPAEAGWRATIAAIDGLFSRGGENWPEADDILAAWKDINLEGGAK